MKAVVFIAFAILFATSASGQTASNEPWPFPDRRRPEEESKFIKEMLAKQQSAKEKKDYASLLERSEHALKLSEKLETAIAKNDRLSDSDRKDLESFEKLVKEIRDDLGGDDDDSEPTGAAKNSPKDVREGILFLKDSTQKLVSEIKKSTRFSVSVVAIESSNALIKVARFLRLRN